MRDLLGILIGPLAWLAWFTAIYGLHGMMCGLGIGGSDFLGVSALTLTLGLAWFGAIAAQIAILVGVHAVSFTEPSIRNMSLMTAWTALVATIWTLLPIAVASSCR